MNDSALGIESGGNESRVKIRGSEKDALVNWVTLTHAICAAYHIPHQALAEAIEQGILDEAGELASMTVIDFGKIFGGRA